MGLIMRPKEMCVGSTRDMERAFQNILDEILEHVIEGLCFDAHRAVKFDYFPLQEYIVKEHEFELYEELPEREGDIYGNDNDIIFAMCPICNQEKAAKALMRHMKTCRTKTNDSPELDNSDITENYENNIDGNNGDEKKGNDVRKQTKSTPNYDAMSPDQKQDFLLKHCGVVSRSTGKPCRNSLNCNIHSKEDKDRVRGFIFECLADQLVDDNIDIDTVD